MRKLDRASVPAPPCLATYRHGAQRWKDLAAEGQTGAAVGSGAGVTPKRGSRPPAPQPGVVAPAAPTVARANAYFGSVDVNATTAKMKLVSIAEEIIALLAADPNATVKVTVEISADFPAGASDQTKRAVSENAASLGFKGNSWE